jgi:glycosyltransferase involved in cell wall biosynthesis
MEEPVKDPHPREIIMVGRWRPVSPVGVDRTIVNLTRQMVALGYRVVVWSPSPDYPAIRKTELPEGIPRFELPVSLAGLRLPRRTLEFVQEQSGRSWLAHFHCAFTPANNAIAARLGCPYTLTPNGPYSPAAFNFSTAFKKRGWLLVSERAYLEKAAFIHALSEQEHSDIQRLCRQPHFVIAPNGISLEGSSAPQGLPVVPAAPGGTTRTLLFLGRLAVHHKGLDRLLSAFAQANVASARLVLAGPDFRSGEARLKKMAGALGIQDRVQFQAAVYGDEKWKVLSQADVFVHFSRWEGIPFAVLEAMSLAKPVLVSRGTNLGDYVIAEQAGWVAPDDDLAGVLRQCLLAPRKELQARGSQAQRLVETQFQWPEIARRVASGYKKYCA